MGDAGYRKRLAADLPKWLDAGWVSAEGAAAILAAAGGAPVRVRIFNLSTILGSLGALLLGLAVLAFVAAQWAEVPRLARFGVIVVGMLIAYGAAFQLARREYRVFAEAGMLAGGLIYGAGIALIGQTYHLAGDFAGAVMLFEAGIIAAALLTGSAAMNVLGLVGAGYWTWLATVEGEPQAFFQQQAPIGLCLHPALEDHGGMASGGLGPIQRHVDLAQHAVDVPRRAGERCDAGAYADHEIMVADAQRRREPRGDVPRDAQGGLRG